MLEFHAVATPQAENDLVVALCCDRPYLPYAAYTAWSVARLHPERKFDIRILGENLDVPQRLRDEFGIDQIDLEITDTKGLKIDKKISSAGYLRLCLPQILGDSYRRILYLDADIVARHGSIETLLGINLGRYPLGAVQDVWRWRHPEGYHPDYKGLGLPEAKYLNSGVLLQDTQCWMSQGVHEAIAKNAIQLEGKLRLHDQTLLNVTLRDNWAELSPIWNWQTHQTTLGLTSTQDPALLHFTGGKPWSDRYGRVPQSAVDDLREFLSTYFPHFDISHISPVRMQSAQRLKMALRSRLHRSEVLHFLGRFPKCTTAIMPAN